MGDLNTVKWQSLNHLLYVLICLNLHLQETINESQKYIVNAPDNWYIIVCSLH